MKIVILITGYGKSVRVVVFMEDVEIYDEEVYRRMAKGQFLINNVILRKLTAIIE